MRRRRPEKRRIVPDPIYGDLIVAKFVNNLMKDGKKSVAERIFYNSLDVISKKEKIDNPLEIFNKALKNASPVVEVKSKRIGGATYQVPIDIPENRRLALAMRWIISFARSRKGNSMVDRLSAELIAASKNEGSTIKKKEDTHKMAEANKAFSHFR
tara:strand:- start:2148 stop:2615 length:468 start_codon:yes stop_codon:yes gene_type:complete